MYKRFCKNCPRRQISHEQWKSEGKYYCQGKNHRFDDKDAFCYTKRKISRLWKNVKELNYKELYDMLGKYIEDDKDFGNKKALIGIGDTDSCIVSTVKGIMVCHDNEGEHEVVQSTWRNGKPTK